MRSRQPTLALWLIAFMILPAACSGRSQPAFVPEPSTQHHSENASNDTQAAAAGSITCTVRNTVGPGGTNVWPYSNNVVGCTGTSRATLGYVQSALQRIVVKYSVDGPKLRGLAPPVWIFHTVANYAAFWGSAANSPLPSGFGVTYVSNIRPGGPNNGKPYTLIFEQSGSLTNPYAGHVAAHEMGHWIDRFIEGSVGNPYSSRPLWNGELSADRANFNALAGPCALPSQIFNGERPFPDLASTPFICANNGQGPALAPGYSGTNTAVLQKAWPMIFGGSVTVYQKEIFADEVATDAGLEWPDLDTYFVRNNWWNCTQTLLKSQLTYGAPPGSRGSPYVWPSGCPKLT